jgi:hypothetical protein
MDRSRITLRLALLLSLCVSACSDDSTEDEHSDEHEHGDGGDDGHSHSHSPADAGTRKSDSLFLIATSFTAGDQTETYLVTTDRWDADTKVDTTAGPKLLGGVVPIVHKGSVFVPDSNSPVLQRYDVGDDDKLELGDEVSFMGAGLTQLSSTHIYILSDKKGYVFDPAGPRILVWDPSVMELTGKEIDLSMVKRDGWSPNLIFEQSGPQRVGDELYVPLAWLDQDGNSRFATGVVVLDVEKDSVVTVDEDERCGESYASVVDPDGNIYFFPPDWSAVAHFYADKHTPTCVLRINAGETVFDKDYALDLSALGSGGAASGAVPDGDSGFFFLTVDEELYDDGNNESGEYWHMYHHDFSSEETRKLDSFPAWAGTNYWIKVGDRTVMPYWRESEDGWVTTMYTVDGSTDPKPVFSFDASWYGAAQLR